MRYFGGVLAVALLLTSGAAHALFDDDIARMRIEELRRQIAAMKKGDMVVTAGGLIGKVIKLDTTTAANAPVNATFAGPSSAEPIKQVLAACGYTLGTPPVRVDPKDKSKK